MIRLLHIIDTGGPGGAETVFLNTASGTDSARYHSTCLVSRDGWLTDSLRKKGLTPVIAPASGSFNVSYLRTIVRTIRRERIDLIVAHLYGSSIYGSLAGLLTGKPVISILHGQTDISGGGRFAALKKLIVRKGSRRIIFVSDKLRSELAPLLGLHPDQCVIIPNGVETSRFENTRNQSIRHQLGLTDKDVLVGAIGNLRKPKAYDVLLRAAARLRASSSNYHFVIAGEGENSLHNDLLKLRSELGLDNAVTFLGLRSDVEQVLGNLDVYALSSSSEGFSIACVEAMAAGIPVVATRSGGPEEIFENEQTGLLVPVGDPEALAAAIARLAADEALSATLATNALRRVHSHYTMSRMLQSYESVFADVAARRPGANA